MSIIIGLPDMPQDAKESVDHPVPNAFELLTRDVAENAVRVDKWLPK